MMISNIFPICTQPFKLALLVIFIFLLNSRAGCQLDTSRFRVIDQKDQNFLIRGNLPITNNQFQFNTLYESLAVFTGTNKFRLVIYGLLNLLTAKQTKSRYIQENQFDHNGIHVYKNIKHQYHSNPIAGALYSPAQYPTFLRNLALKFYNQLTFDNIPQLMSNIQKDLASPVKTIVYFHCSQGVDRAGYVSAAYKMKNLGYSLADAMAQNFQIVRKLRGHMHFNSFNGLQWYCLYLGKSQKQCLIEVQKANYILTFQQYTNQTIEQQNNKTKDKKQKNKKANKAKNEL